MKITINRPGLTLEFEDDDPLSASIAAQHFLDAFENIGVGTTRGDRGSKQITADAPTAKTVLEFVGASEHAHSVNYIVKESGIPKARTVIQALIKRGDLELHDAFYTDGQGRDRPMRGVYLKGFFDTKE